MHDHIKTHHAVNLTARRQKPLFTMNFAPYQDDSPESNRVASPIPRSSTSTPQTHPTQPKPQNPASYKSPYVDSTDDLPDPDDFDTAQNQAERGLGQQGPRGFGNTTERNMDVFSTSLPMRLDYEACMAYVLLPPAGGALLLMLEHKSDYVRLVAR